MGCETLDQYLERYYLGMLDAEELEAVQNHLIGCALCVARAEAIQDYVDTMRAAIISGDYDL